MQKEEAYKRFCKELKEMRLRLEEVEKAVRELLAAMKYTREVIADCIYSIMAFRVRDTRLNELMFTNTDLQEACYAMTRYIPTLYDIKQLLGGACTVEVKSFRLFEVRCNTEKLVELLKARGYLS